MADQILVTLRRAYENCGPPRSDTLLLTSAFARHGNTENEYGPAEMYAYIPASDLSGAETSDFVYLRSHFVNINERRQG